MAYTPTEWKDRAVERPRTFTMQNNPDGTVTLIPAPGVVAQEGTPVNAANLNNIEQGLVTHMADKVAHWHFIEKIILDVDTAQLDITIPSEYKEIRIIGKQLKGTSISSLKLTVNGDTNNSYYKTSCENNAVSSETSSYLKISSSIGILRTSGFFGFCVLELNINENEGVTVNFIDGVNYVQSGAIEYGLGIWKNANDDIVETISLSSTNGSLGAGTTFEIWGR